ncbi:MAG: hypothetical protein IJ111_04755 [Eggerthellaceae bacterium]|nr:hypothetical protein [Eggerthellaceae bacterium]
MMLMAIAVMLSGCAANPGGGSAVPAEEAQGVVYDALAGAWYDDMESAFASAADGATLYVYEDLESGALQSSADKLAVDLQGHALTIDAVGSGARGGQGLAHDGIGLGAGEYAISNGTVSVTVGAQPETTQSATAGYRGVSAEEGSNLALSNVDLSVAYAGTSTIMPGVELAGVETGGSLTLQDGSAISVESASARDAFGASTAAGVHAKGTDGACTIAVSDDSSIAVDNRSAQVMQGAIGYPTTVFGTTKTTNSELMEIAVDPSLGWYDDMCARFLANARYDDREDADGFVYGAEVYYASPLELENGLNVWAFTDPMAAGVAGLPENIVPTHVFVRSDYALPLDAYGIWCDEGFAGSVSQEGALSATTTLGHAIGVYEGASGTYEVDEDTISATCGKGAFRADAGPFDFGDYVDVPVSPDVSVSYPAQSAYTSVREESPVAWKTAVAGEEAWVYASLPIAFDDLFTEWGLYGEVPAEDETETTIGLSLTYYRMSQDGYLYTGEEAGTYTYSPELDLIDVANERIRPGDIVEIGGVKNRFLGWSPRMSDKEPLYTDHILLEKQNWGSFGAKCALYGIYEIVVDEPEQEGAQATAGQSGQTAQPVQAVSSTIVETGQLPTGGLDAGATQEEVFSSVGGMAVIGGFALVVVAACLLWRARGRKLVALEAEAASEEASSQEEQKRKGGIRF